MDKEQQKKLLIEIMEADEKDGLYKPITALEWFLNSIPQRFRNMLINECFDEIQQARQMKHEQIEISDAGKDTADYIDRHIIESMKELAIEGFKPQKHMATRVKVTWIAILDGKPIVSAGTSEDLRKGLDEYYAVDRTDAKCLGFIPYQSKFPDEYEGNYSYSYTMILRDVKHTEIDTVKVYCIDYYPQTTYEI